MQIPRRCRLALLVVLGISAAANARAQGTITLAAGALSAIQVAPGSKVGVPIIVDMSNAGGGTNLAALTTGVTWGTTRLAFDSVKAGAFGSLTSGLANVASGSATLSLFSSEGTTSTATVATLWFTASATTGGTRIVVNPTVAGNEAAANLLPIMLTRGLDVCVAPTGIWGDANGDASVNIIDAQQIARFGIDLDVANVTAMTRNGDINIDGHIDIIDAQQIARFSVGLSSPARVGTNLFVVPAVASVSIAGTASPTVTTGATTQLTAVPRDAGSADLTGCLPVSWSSSNTARATVSGSGVVTGVSAGTSTITATSGGQSSQVTVTVTSNLAGASASVSAGNNQVVIAGNSVPVAPSILVKDAANQPVSGAAVTFAVTSGGGTVTGGSVSTNESGIATVGSWTLGATAGTNTLSATVAGSGITGNPVTFTATSTVATIALSSTGVNFSGNAGASSPAAQTVTVTNSGTGALGALVATVAYQPSQPTGWLSATLNTVVAPATLTLTPTTGALSAGTYSATVSVASTTPGVANSPQTVTVTFTVVGAPAIALSSTTSAFASAAGGANPAQQVVSVTNGGTGALSGLASSVAYQNTQPTGWLSATLNTTTAPATLTLVATTGTLAVGTYNATVSLTSSAPGIVNSPQTIGVTFTVRTQLASGVVVAGTIAASGQSNDYAFTGAAGDVVSFALASTEGFTGNGSGGADAMGVLLSPAGTVLQTFYSNSVINATLATSGAYVMRVSAANLTQSGSYNLAMQAIAPADPAAEAMTPGALVTGSITQAAQSRAYTFAGTAGNVVAVTLVGSSGFASGVRGKIYSPAGGLLQTIYNNTSTPVALATNGTYVVWIDSYTLTQSGTYRIGVQSLTPADPSAVALAIGGTATGSISQAGQFNEHTFIGQAGTIGMITLASTEGFETQGGNSSADAKAVVYSPTGAIVTTAFSNGFLKFPIATAGTYVIRVGANNLLKTGSYALGLQIVSPPDGTAIALTSGTQVSGTIIQPAQAREYSFAGATGSTVALSLVGMATRADVISPDGGTVSVFFGGSIVNAALPATGTYVVVIHAANMTATGTFALQMTSLIPADPAAVVLTSGSIVAGSITQAGQFNEYTFAGSANGVATLGLASTAGFPDGGEASAIATVYSPAGTLVQTVGTNGFYQVPLPTTGTYVVRISAGNLTQTGAYVVSMQSVSPPDPAAVALTSGAVVSASITQVGQSNQYTFPASAGSVATVTLVSTSGFTSSGGFPTDARATIYSPSGATLQTLYSNASANVTLASAGTYVVKVNAGNLTRTGTYKISMISLIPADPSAVPMSSGSALAGTISQPAQFNAYSYAGTAGTVASISLASTGGFTTAGSNNPADAKASVFSPAGVEIQAAYSNGFAQFAVATTGTYVVRVGASNLIQTGSYVVGIQTVGPAGANAAALASGANIGSITQAGQTNLYTFSCGANATASMTIASNSGFTGTNGFGTDARVDVYSSSGTLAKVLYSNSSGDIAVTAGATYTVRVAASNLTQTGTYTLTLNCH